MTISAADLPNTNYTSVLLKERGDLIWAVWQSLMLMKRFRERLHDVSTQAAMSATQLSLATMRAALLNTDDLSQHSVIGEGAPTEMWKRINDLQQSLGWASRQLTEIGNALRSAEDQYSRKMMRLGLVHNLLGGRSFSADRRIDNILYRIVIEGEQATLHRPDLEDEAQQELQDGGEDE